MRAIVGVALAAVLLAGCGRSVAGSAQPNRAESDRATAAAYAKGIEAFQAHFRRLGDEKAKVYNYFIFGDTRRTNEFESAKLGDPPATTWVKTREKSGGANDGDPVTFLHPADAEVDYLKLDRRHARLAPTPWVSVPTTSPKGVPFDPISLVTSWVAVKLDAALSQTKLDAPDRQERTVRSTRDGYELHSGITLKSAIDGNLASVPDELKGKVPTDMTSAVIPVRIDFGPNWEFRKFEVVGTVPGDPELRIQVGYEVAGEASRNQFPPTPQPAEVTAITDSAAVDKFYDDLSKNEP
jgi:hypothetical protein